MTRTAPSVPALSEVVATTGPRALVTTGSGRIWSNGLDLDWMGAHPEQSTALLDQVHGLFGRFLSACVATVAAVQGRSLPRR